MFIIRESAPLKKAEVEKCLKSGWKKIVFNGRTALTNGTTILAPRITSNAKVK